MGKSWLEFRKQPYYEVSIFHNHRLISKKYIKDTGEKKINIENWGYFNRPSDDEIQYLDGYGMLLFVNALNSEPLKLMKKGETLKKLSELEIIENTIHPQTWLEIAESDVTENVSHSEASWWIELKAPIIFFSIIIMIIYFSYVIFNMMGVL